MHEAVAAPLPAWEAFYVITGAAAAALTGLMFVAITLVAGERARREPGGIGVFSTPTVVHLGTALVVAGVAGLTYGLAVARRARRLVAYRPVAEDWLWHLVLPLAAYAALAAAGLALPWRPPPALFGVGAVTVLLLVIGIHNAWDIVTYVAVEPMSPADPRRD